MKVMALLAPGAGKLEPGEREVPIALPGELLIRVRACGVCAIDLQTVDGQLTPGEFPIVPGHEIVGVVDVVGDGVTEFQIGDRVGVPPLAYTCGACEFCASGRENLCRTARFAGLDMDGGCAEFVVADAAYVFKLPEQYSDPEAATLLCAGVTAYRAYRMIGDARRLGMYGFDAGAHLVAQIAVHQQREVYAFTPPGDEARQALARSFGCAWAGGFADVPPAPLDAAIVFAADGGLVTEALSRLVPGGVLVCTAARMSDVPSFAFDQLADERTIRTVTNMTRDAARELIALAGTMRLEPRVQTYELADANRALGDLRDGRILGAVVLTL